MLEDRGDASQFEMECPLCHAGVVNTATGAAHHTPQQLSWKNMQCSYCHRTFNFTAQRTPPVVTS